MPAPPIEVRADRQAPLGMAPAQFLERHWQKHPLLVRGAFAGLQLPLQPDDLAGLSCEPWALSRLIRHDAVTDAWSVTHGPLPEDAFDGLPDRDWTLLVQDVDKWDADVAALLARFDFLPAWRIDDVMVSFAAPGGSVGAHVDQYDVFLLQGQGRRRWQISTDPQAPTALREDAELKLLREFAPTHDWVLEPGDMLYLPPDVPHHGVALDACMTFSVGMRAPAAAELLTDLAEHLAEGLGERRRYADPDLQPPSDAYEIDAAALARVRATHPLLAAVDEAVLRDWFGRFITRYRSAGELAAPPQPPAGAQLTAALARGARLVRHPLARMAWTRSGAGATLFVSGQAWPCTPEIARALCADAVLDRSGYEALDAAARELLHHLLREGCFALESD